MHDVVASHILFFLAGSGATALVGGIVLAHRDVRALSKPDEDLAPEPAGNTPLLLTTGLYPALADLHEPPTPDLPTHEWWLEETAPFPAVEKREPIADPDVLTGRMRWGGQRPELRLVRANGVDLMSPLTPDDPALRVCDEMLAGAA